MARSEYLECYLGPPLEQENDLYCSVLLLVLLRSPGKYEQLFGENPILDRPTTILLTR